MFLRKLFAVDLGTDNTIVYAPSRGIIFNEPTYIAINSSTKKVLCIGEEAKKMAGKTPSWISVIRPLSQGAIANLDATARFLHHLIDTLMRKGAFFAPEIVVSIPFDLNVYERDAVKRAGVQGGAGSVWMVEDPYSAAVGAGIDFASPEGSLLLDIGSGVTEISLLGSGSIVASRSVRSAGWDFEQEIMNHFHAVHAGEVSRPEAERLKMQLSSETSKTHSLVHVKRRQMLPLGMEVPLQEVREALKPGIERLMEFIRSFLRTVPPGFAPYIKERGLYLTGGSALLGGLVQQMEKELSLPVILGNNPLQEIAMGAGRMVEERRHFSYLFS